MNFLSEDQVIFFPSDELLRAESIVSNKELLAQRLYALWKLGSDEKKILVTHPSAFLRFLPSPEVFKKNTIDLKVGCSFDLANLKSKLVELGYSCVNRVEGSLQFASRGDIIDVFTVSYLSPIRIEFFGDQIESIRMFDLQTQISKEQLQKAVILPATDMLLTDSQTSNFASLLEERISLDEEIIGKETELRANANTVLERFLSRDYRNENYKYYGYAVGVPNSVITYFHPEIIFFSNKESVIENCDLLQREADEYFHELFSSGKIVSHLREYMSLDEAVSNKKKVVYSSPFSILSSDYSFHAHKIATGNSSVVSLANAIGSYLSTNDKIVIFVSDEHQRETIVSLLKERKLAFEQTKGFDFPEGKIGITKQNLSEGFELPSLRIAFLSSNDLFGKKTSVSRFSSRFKEGTILRSYEDLKPGDYVVHEYYGIGQFLDVKTKNVNGVSRDYLYIAYAKGEYLYTPLEQFRMVRKYSGREGASPRLSSLSGKEWTKRKAHIKERVNELADRLIDLYKTRANINGFAFAKDDEYQKQFENEFPFQLTLDQTKALSEIKTDMEKPEVMDRLLCGDVGFGKTEVAFRAAFKAINNGKQVAILCPTTILARQHFEVALQRFSTFGIRIALFSRMVPENKQKEYIEGVSAGKIHLVIGTHRLLSKDISFKDLGLLIVDEEQRFGVEQKERIKEMSKDIDVLTLSATPIPRTLQMSLVGIRPLSEINTAPENRMPIQTYVVPFKESLVKELVSRELARDGQVFYVHNRVDTIYEAASKLASEIPSSKVGVVHGQMDKNEIEDVMIRFYDGEINVLVCTSIVENGIDIPNANLIIVENADKFGLSQLYQIKGRVGRGDRIAYAYLMYKEYKRMNEDAQKRLEAIQEFTELGSGYKIAQRDLMIRGAGDILGPEQAGFIDSIGLDLYLKMLNEAIEAKKNGLLEAPPPKKNKILNINAYFPKDYASREDKISLYQELSDIKNNKELSEFKRKIRDIYGKIPDEVYLLLKKKNIDILLDHEEFKNITETEKTIDVVLSSSFTSINGIGSDLFNYLVPSLGFVKVSFLNKELTVSVYKRESWISDLETVLDAIHKTYAKRKEAA